MKTKNIKLAVIENDLNIIKQLQKVKEEYREFIGEFSELEIYEDYFNRDYAVAEGLDLIQATFTLLNKLGLSDEDIEKHLQKIEEYRKIGRI